MKGRPQDISQLSQEEVVEHVKARLLEEGREARNLIAYSLPLQDSSESASSSSVDELLNSEASIAEDTNKAASGQHSCGKLMSSTSSSYHFVTPTDSSLMPPPPPPASPLSSASSSSLSSHRSYKFLHRGDGSSSVARRNSLKQEKRSRSVSAGRNPQQCLRARHWGFLFRNLQQAVDQIYQTCETDESVIECREAILMLERYTKDFCKLIDWLKIKWEYENTPPPQRPTSLAWEIRTSSQTSEARPLTLKDVRRALNFDTQNKSGNLNRELHSPDPSRVQQLAAEIAADLTLSNRLNLAAKVDRVLFDKNDKAWSERLEATLSKLEEKGHVLEEGDELSTLILGSNSGSPVHANSKQTETKPPENSCAIPSISVEVSSINNHNSPNDQSLPNVKDTPISVDTHNKPNSNSDTNEKSSVEDSSNQLFGGPGKSLTFPKVETLLLNDCVSSINVTKEGSSDTSNDELKLSANNKTQEKANCNASKIKSSGSSNKSTSVEPVIKVVEGKDKELSTSVDVDKKNKTVNSEKDTDKKDSDASSKKKPSTVDAAADNKKKNNEAVDVKKSTIDTSNKTSVRVPTVNMNKAWQVRQAFNQSRTPLRQHPGEPRCTAPTAPLNNRTRAPTPITQVPMNRGGSKRLQSVTTGRRTVTCTAPRTPLGLIRSHTTLAACTDTVNGISQSWADKVRGHHTNGAASSTASSASLQSTQTEESSSGGVRGVTSEDDGWELVVRRGRRSHGGSTASLNNRHNSGGVSGGDKGSTAWMKRRFDVPSTATSMPSLAALSGDEKRILLKTGRHSSGSHDLTASSTSRRVSLDGGAVSSLCTFDDDEEVCVSKTAHKNKKNSTSDADQATAPSDTTSAKHGKSSGSDATLFDNKRSARFSNSSSTKENLKKCFQDNNKSKAALKISLSDDQLNKNKAQKKSNANSASKQSRQNIKSYKVTADKQQKNGHVPMRHDPKNFFSRGKSASDVSIEFNRKNLKNKQKSSLVSTARKSKDLESITARMLDSAAKNSRECFSAARLSAGDAFCSRYGALMAEVYEVDEELPEPLVPDDSLSSYLSACAESSITAGDCVEDAAEEEQIRHNAEALECAVQEERRLKQQIQDTENTDCVNEEEEDAFSEGLMSPTEAETPPAASDSLLDHDTDDSLTTTDSQTILEMFANLDWSEEVVESNSSRVLDSAGVREPGRVLQIHEKLSSPSRKLSLTEKQRRHSERLAKAELLRQSHMASKTEKLRELLKKIEEVNADKVRLQLEKRELLMRKMERAEKKRQQHLQDIVDKAHDEDNKGREIAFINGLEAQNKLHDMLQQHQSHSSRLADMAEERSRRQEEKAAKEAAAQERRKALEAERQARLLRLCEKRRERCERIDRQQAERREELLEQAREKERDRQERRTALMQAQQAKECELVRRIQQKQQESARRHEENIEQIKRRALESSILRCSRGCDDAPKIGRYERQKFCTLCNCFLSSEVYLLSHLRGARHQESLKELHSGDNVSSEDTASYNLKHIVDAPDNLEDPQVVRDKERQKSLKKRCRKIRSRMNARGRDYDGCYKSSGQSNSQNNKRISKALNNISKLLRNQGTGPWCANEVASLDKSLLELLRILDKTDQTDQNVFCALNGFERITELLSSLITEEISKSNENEDNKNSNLQSKRKGGNKKQSHSSPTIDDLTDDSLSIESHEVDGTDRREPPLCALPPKSIGLCSKVLHAALRDHPDNSRHLLHSNLVSVLLDWLVQRLSEIKVQTTAGSVTAGGAVVLTLPSDPAVTHTLLVLAEVLTVVSKADLPPPSSNNSSNGQNKNEAAWLRLQDMISYSVCVGVADRLSWYLSHVQGQSPLDSDPGVAELILSAMNLLSAMATTLHTRGCTSKDDPTQLLNTLQVTEACGVVSLLYGLLLHDGGRSSYLSSSSSPSSSSPTPLLTPSATPSPSHQQSSPDEGSSSTSQPPKLPAALQSITVAATTLLHSLAMLDLKIFQGVLGSEGISLELRHVASYLLWYCSSWSCEAILHNVIALVGFLTVNNKDNQCVVHSGETPTVLQQLCALPWQYFSEPRLTTLLFPTLLACCTGSPHNTAILHSEMSPQILEDFLKDESQASDNPLMLILRQSQVSTPA